MRERDLQVAVMEYLAVALPPDAFAFHPVNEGRRSLAFGARLKREGMVAGVPDICVIYQGRAHWCELKSLKGSISPAQKATHKRLRECGCGVMVCRSLADVELFLDGMGVPLRAHVEPKREVARAA